MRPLILKGVVLKIMILRFPVVSTIIPSLWLGLPCRKKILRACAAQPPDKCVVYLARAPGGDDWIPIIIAEESAPIITDIHSPIAPLKGSRNI